jgi:DNA-binding NtrC family response regulator
VESLARHFLDLHARRHDRPGIQLSAPALTALRAHAWPGNVRELEHAIERAVVMSPGLVIEPAFLGLLPPEVLARGATTPPAGPGVTLPLGLPLGEVERRYVEATVAAQGGNLSRAAEALEVGRNTLKRVRAKKARDAE